MSFLNLSKKLLPAGKAWKGFTSKVQKKIHKLKRFKAIKKTTNRLNTTFTTVLGGSRSLSSPRLRRKRRILAVPSSILRPCHENHHLRRSFAPVYVDELFMEPVSVRVKHPELPVTNKVGEKGAPSVAIGQSDCSAAMEIKFLNRPALPETSMARETGMLRIIDAPGSPALVESELPGIDERAEEFIAKFREEMKLQRQRSFGDFQEMLARSA